MAGDLLAYQCALLETGPAVCAYWSRLADFWHF